MRLLAPSLLALVLSACSKPAPSPASSASPQPSPSPASSPTLACDPILDDGGRFQAAKVEGVFVVRDAQSDCLRTTNAALADSAFLPHSTFKIPNSFIGLETGVIEGEAHHFAWDGTKRSVEGWNRDHDLGSALQASCVWCFQDIARRIGDTRMRTWLRDFGYGNEHIDGGPIDEFWLTGSLRISPRQQIDFVRRSLEGKLPVRKANVDLVWRLLEIESRGQSRWHGKTGLGPQDGRVVGWLVGYAEREGRRYEYATFVRGDAFSSEEMDRVAAVRKPLTRAWLAEMGALDPE